ncbi:MAG: hypothetical protein ACLGIV_07915 [Actinomycetes bacterium]
MSPAVAPARAVTAASPSRAAGRAEPRRATGPRLRVVTAPPSPRGAASFAAGCAALLAVTLVALLMLNITLSRGAYQVHELESRRDQLAERQQALEERLAVEAAPGRLADRAAALGMVPNPNPAVLRLEDGAVLGSPAPAPPPPPSAPRAAP